MTFVNVFILCLMGRDRFINLSLQFFLKQFCQF